MVKNTNGKWDSFKPNFRQSDIVFKDGTKIRTIVCEDCLGEDPRKFIEAITAKDSEACSQRVAAMIKAKGLPEKMEIASNVKQGVRLVDRKI